MLHNYTTVLLHCPIFPFFTDLSFPWHTAPWFHRHSVFWWDPGFPLNCMSLVRRWHQGWTHTSHTLWAVTQSAALWDWPVLLPYGTSCSLSEDELLPGKFNFQFKLFMTGLMWHKTTLLKNPARIPSWSSWWTSIVMLFSSKTELLWLVHQHPMLIPECKTHPIFGDQQCWIFQQWRHMHTMSQYARFSTILYAQKKFIKRVWCLNSSIHEAVNEQHLSDLLGKYDNSDAATCTFYAP